MKRQRTRKTKLKKYEPNKKLLYQDNRTPPITVEVVVEGEAKSKKYIVCEGSNSFSMTKKQEARLMAILLSLNHQLKILFYALEEQEESIN